MPDTPDTPQEPNEPGTPPGGAPPVVNASRVVAGLCLLAPFVALLWVNSYSRVTPRFIGIPFFYWYQMLWVPVAAALTYTAYLLVRHDERSRKGGAGQ